MNDDYTLYNNDCLDVLSLGWTIDCLFADPPDNIGLKYKNHNDNLPEEQYISLFRLWIERFTAWSPITWISFNAKWMQAAGSICNAVMFNHFEFKPCVQTFTFGQHNQYDLGNCHRPLWRFRLPSAPLYPDQVRVPSWRQLNGDKRADHRGKVPGDHFDFPRVTNRSKQRRSWCPTQLHEGLVERCILLSTKPGDLVFDPFAGSGTVLRVCKRLKRRCVACEIDLFYCDMIAAENNVKVEKI